MVTRLYFHDATSALSNLPTAEQSALTATVTVDADTINRTMNTDIGAGPQIQKRYVNASTSQRTLYVTRFVSDPINQTSIAANTWTFNFAIRESNLAANFPVAGSGTSPVCCYVWRPGVGKVGDILDSATGTSTLNEATTGITVRHATFSGSAVAGTQLGDVIVFEVWFVFTQGTTTSRNDDFFYDGTTANTTEGATVTNHASFIETPENIVWGPRTFVRTVNETVVVDATAGRQRIVAPGTPQNVKVGVITKDTTTGAHTQNFTNEAGFAPQWGIFIMSGKTASGTGAHIQNSVGITDGTNHYCVSRRNINGNNSAGSSVNSFIGTDNYTMGLYPTVSGSATTTEGTVIFGSNGWDISWGKADAVQNKIIYMVGGGGGFSEAKVTTHTQGSAPYQFTNTIQGDIVFFVHAPAGTIDTLTATVNLDIGCATSSSSRWAVDFSTNSGFNTAASRMQRTDLCLVGQSNGLSTRGQADFEGWLSNGFDLGTFTGGNATDSFGSLVIKGGLWDVGAFNQNTSNGTQQVNITSGRTPEALLLATFGNAASASLVTEARMSIGLTDGTTEACIWDGFQAGSSTSYINGSDFSDTKLIRCLDETAGSGTLQTEADWSSFQSGSFTVNNTTTDATSRQICYIAFTPEEAPGGVLYERTASETPQIADSVGRLYKSRRTASETLTIAASPVRMYRSIRTASETLTIDAQVVRLRRVLAPVSATAAAADSVLRLYLARRTLSESPTIAASVAKVSRFFRTASDSLTVAGNVVQRLRAIRTVPESLTIAANVASVKRLLRSASGSLTISANVVSVRRVLRSVSESLTIADTIARLRKITKTLSETPVVVDNVARMLKFYRTLSESLTIVDLAEAAKLFTRSLSESLNVDVQVVRMLKAYRTLSETPTVAANVARMLKFYRTLSESLSIAGAVLSAKHFTRSLTESLNIDATVVRLLKAYRTVNNSLTIDTQVTKLRKVISSLSEELAISANSVSVRKVIRTLSESLVIDAVIARAVSVSRLLTESITINASAIGLKAFFRSLTESVIVSGVVATAISITRSLSESLTLNDSVARMSKITRTLSESLALADSITRLRRVLKTLSESLTVSANAVRVKRMIRSVSNSLTVIANVARIRDMTRSVSALVTINDNVVKILRQIRSLSESLTIDVVVAKSQTLTRTVSESFTIVTNAVQFSGLTIVRSVSESFTITADVLLRACWFNGGGPVIYVAKQVGRLFSVLPQRGARPYTVRSKFSKYDEKE